MRPRDTYPSCTAPNFPQSTVSYVTSRHTRSSVLPMESKDRSTQTDLKSQPDIGPRSNEPTDGGKLPELDSGKKLLQGRGKRFCRRLMLLRPSLGLNQDRSNTTRAKFYSQKFGPIQSLFSMMFCSVIGTGNCAKSIQAFRTVRLTKRHS